jgi:hypothetical protein
MREVCCATHCACVSEIETHTPHTHTSRAMLTSCARLVWSVAYKTLLTRRALARAAPHSSRMERRRSRRPRGSRAGAGGGGGNSVLAAAAATAATAMRKSVAPACASDLYTRRRACHALVVQGYKVRRRRARRAVESEAAQTSPECSRAGRVPQSAVPRTRARLPLRPAQQPRHSSRVPPLLLFRALCSPRFRALCSLRLSDRQARGPPWHPRLGMRWLRASPHGVPPRPGD